MNQTIKNRIDQIKQGQIPEGYRKTSFGVFPIEWETDKTFGDLFNFYGGLGKSREELGDSGVEYLHYGDMHRGEFYKVSYDQYSILPKCDVHVKGDETFLMKDGDVAFLDASEDLEGTSRAVLIDNPENKPFIAGLHTFVAKPKSDTLSKYYKQYITIPEFVYKQFQRLACGFKVYGLNRNTITWIKYAYPKEKIEQGKIAEILMKWDEAIELQEEYIQKLELRKRIFIQKLLMNKPEWSICSLGDILQENLSKTTVNNQFPAVSSTKDGLFLQRDYFDKQVASDNNIGYKTIRPGQIVLSPQNLWLGNINYNSDIPYGMVSPSYKVFDINAKYNKLFIATIMRQTKMLYYYAISSEQGASVVRRNLNMELFYDITVRVPSKFEQDTIAEQIIIANNGYDKQVLKLKQLKEQRKALMQLLLTGIVRI